MPFAFGSFDMVQFNFLVPSPSSDPTFSTVSLVPSASLPTPNHFLPPRYLNGLGPSSAQQRADIFMKDLSQCILIQIQFACINTRGVKQWQALKWHRPDRPELKNSAQKGQRKVLQGVAMHGEFISLSSFSSLTLVTTYHTLTCW